MRYDGALLCMLTQGEEKSLLQKTMRCGSFGRANTALTGGSARAQSYRAVCRDPRPCLRMHQYADKARDDWVLMDVVALFHELLTREDVEVVVARLPEVRAVSCFFVVIPAGNLRFCNVSQPMQQRCSQWRRETQLTQKHG